MGSLTKLINPENFYSGPGVELGNFQHQHIQLFFFLFTIAVFLTCPPISFKCTIFHEPVVEQERRAKHALYTLFIITMALFSSYIA